MNKIKVLQIGKYYYPYVGGIETHLYTLINELSQKVEIKALVSNIKFKTSIEKDGSVMVYRLATLGSIFSLPLTFSLPIWLKRLKSDILHFHLPNPLAVIAFFLVRPSGKVIITYHNDIIRQCIFLKLFNPLLIRFLKKAEVIIVTSQNLLDSSSVLSRFKDKCKIIPHGIDLSKFILTTEVANSADEIKQKFGSPIILFVGRLVYFKGLEYLFEALKDIDARLLILGEGPVKNKLKKLAGRLGIYNKVVWVGQIQNEKTAAYYYASDALVLPSVLKSESFGIVQLEAFACEKPVISTDLPTGVPYVNLHRKTGLIVAPRDSQAITQAISTLLTSKELAQQYGRQGKERLEHEFTKENMSQAVLRIYYSLFN